MGDERQKIQLELALETESKGEAPMAVTGGTESSVARREAESPASDERLMEEVLEAGNLKEALKRVKTNKGSPGADGMTVGQLPGYLKGHWPKIREQMLQGIYVPQPVLRVEIEKPDGSGRRKLGIPRVVDRFLQQAVMQVLQERWDRSFSEHSYGFRPGRNAHQAVAQAQGHMAQGYRWVVDLDLEKFFDRVNHDKLMGKLAQRIKDKRVLKLIRAFLKAGVMEGGLVSPIDEGTPQGGPLSPLLSNMVLDELDKELERRGHRFARYADDANIYVRSQRAGERVMQSISSFITQKLKLKVNSAKSAVARPWERKFLGFSFTWDRQPKRRIAPKAAERFKAKIRELTDRTRSVSLEKRIEELGRYLQGWQGYFGYCQTPSTWQKLDEWLKHRLRSVLWKQWKTSRRRFAELRQRGIGKDLAAQTVGSSHGPWRIGCSPALHIGLSNAYFERLGLPRLTVQA